MTENHSTSAARLALVKLACALVVLALAGCSAASPAPAPSTGSASSSSASPVSPAKLAVYQKLLTLDDVKRVSKVSSATTMPPGMRDNDSLYYVLFTNPDKPQFLAFSVGKPEAFEAQRMLLAGKETTLTVGGHEAISWSSGEFDSGIAVRMPGGTYMVTSRWVFVSPEGMPQISMDEIKQFAELVVKRSQ